MIYELRYIFGAVFILIGLVLALFGRQLWVFTVFLACALLSFVAIMYIYYTILSKPSQAAWIGWAILGGSLVVGVVLGLLMTKFARAGASILAVWGGFILGMVLTEALLFQYITENSFWFWLVCGSCAAVAGVLVFVAYNHAVILASSLVGSYLFIRGISLYAGGFPDEFLLFKEVKSGMLVNEPLTFYLYLAGVVIATVISAVVQYRALAKMDEDQKHPYEKLR